MSNSRRARTSSPVTSARSEAEVSSRVSEFVFRGVTVSVDWDKVPIQRALLAIRLVSNQSLPSDRRLQFMVDVYEHVLGADQLANLYETCPDILFDADASAEFWELVNSAIHGISTPKY